MRRFLAGLALVIAFAFGAGSTMADEIEDSLAAALEAYRAGDIATAREEIEYAQQLLAQLRAEGLKGFLPEALEGWRRIEEETESAAMAAFGGGMSAAASYERDGQTVDIQIMADNQMVASMAMLFANPAMMGTMGRVKRINRQKVVITSEGEIQALVNGRILIQISGTAPVEDKEAYFAAIDLRGLKEF